MAPHVQKIAKNIVLTDTALDVGRGDYHDTI